MNSQFNIKRKVAYLPAVLTAGVLFFAGAFFIQVVESNLLDRQRTHVLQEASVIRVKLEGTILANSNLVRGLTASISTEPDMGQTRFAELARHLFDGRDALRNIAAAPGLVIKMMYPLKGNEAAIGLDYTHTAGQRAAALEARDARELILAGPLKLVQGGTGLIGRIPVFIPVKNPAPGEPKEKFWGLISAVIDVDKLYKLSGVIDPNLDINIALRGKDATGMNGPVFYGNPALFEGTPVLNTIQLPFGSWAMAAAPKQGWQTKLPNEWIYWMLLAVLELMVVMPLVQVARLLNERADIIGNLQNSQAELESKTHKLTELAQTENELRKRAELGERSKSEFLASMSHEIRTPMTAVKGYADLLMDGDMSDTHREKVRHIIEASNSLLVIMNDILDLSKLDTGRISIEKKNENLQNLVLEALSLCEQTASPEKLRQVSLRCVFNSDFPTTAYIDATRVRQVLLNLLGNALKFTQQGQIRVVCDRRIDCLAFHVIDTGIGINPETLPKLFKDFSQADASISRAFQGAGLGLSICKRLVELMGGQIGVSSEPGKGSDFWFELPYELDENEDTANTEVQEDVVKENAIKERPADKPNEVAPAEDSAREAPATKDTPSKLDSLHILVAEDNELNQMIIKRLLDKMGHTYELAENGIEVLDKLPGGHFDLILMDIRMPLMSGLDATVAIRAREDALKDIPIIAVTADVVEDHVAKYWEAGVNALVPKPIDRHLLAEKIADCVNSPRTHNT